MQLNQSVRDYVTSVHVENIYTFPFTDPTEDLVCTDAGDSPISRVSSREAVKLVYTRHLHVILFPRMYKECCAVTLPTFLLTDSAENILLGGQAKHFISRISVKEAVDSAYSVQVSPNFVAYIHLAIIP